MQKNVNLDTIEKKKIESSSGTVKNSTLRFEKIGLTIFLQPQTLQNLILKSFISKLSKKLRIFFIEKFDLNVT